MKQTVAFLLVLCMLLGLGALGAGCAGTAQVTGSAYALAAALGYAGTADAFYGSLAREALGQEDAYASAVEQGYTGTKAQFLSDVVGQPVQNVPENTTAYTLAVNLGYTGTSQEWLDTLSVAEDVKVVINTVKPSFAWIDDDGKAKVNYLFDWAVENQVPFTSALITGNLDTTSGWLTSQRVQEMYETGLVTFASHTENHVLVGEATQETARAQLANSRAQIEALGIPCDIMVYPQGSISDENMDLVREFYSWGFLAGGNVNPQAVPTQDRVNFPPVNTYRLTRVAIRGNMTEENGGMDYIRAQIDDAIANNGMLVFMSHVGSTMGYDENGNYGYLPVSADMEVYDKTLEYIRQKGYDIEPVSTVLDRFQNSVEIGRWSEYEKEGYFVIGADGRVEADHMNAQLVAPNNSYTAASTPGSYPQNQITTCCITGGAYGAGLPEGTRGILTAYLVGNSGYRTFMPATSANLYVQIRSSTSDAWNSWVKVNSNVTSMLSNNKINHTTKPTTLPSGVSMCIITNSTALAALPGEGKTGYLTTYRISSNAANLRQEWQPFDSVTTYVRLANSSTTWGPWYKLEPVLVE